MYFYLIPTKKREKSVFLIKKQKFRTKTPSKIPHAGMYQAPTSTASAASAASTTNSPSQAPLETKKAVARL